MRLLQACMLVFTLVTAASNDAAAQASDRSREELHQVPLVEDDGTVRSIQMRLCWPNRPGLAPLALLNHGMPRSGADFTGYFAYPCDSEAVRWFVARGFVAAMPLRRGYGATGGTWAERFSCQADDFRHTANETARDIRAALEYARAINGIDGTRPVVVVGQSAGGLGALALASQSPAGLGVVISFAGGVGGTNCRVDLLTEATRSFGSTARVPSLWIYTENDSFFSPDVAVAMYRAYTEGGGLAELHQLPPWGKDGHLLFFRRSGSEVWGPIVEEFLIRTGTVPLR